MPLDFEILQQPNDETCGPTCLHALYQYYGDDISLTQVVEEVERVTNGGTLAPLLGAHALKRGYQCEIYVYNVRMFDPSWFYPVALSSAELLEKLKLQDQYITSPTLLEASIAHQRFLELGGVIHFQDLTVGLLKKYFKLKMPILSGLSATFLYRCARELEIAPGQMIFDDIRGSAIGHFVILFGYEDNKSEVIVADPQVNPLYNDHYYLVKLRHLINAIMIGVLTHDANMLMIYPKGTQP